MNNQNNFTREDIAECLHTDFGLTKSTVKTSKLSLKQTRALEKASDAAKANSKKLIAGGLILGGGIYPVSYTHLTLPTKA